MDPITHTIFGLIASNNRYSLLVTIVLSNLPDILAFPFKLFYLSKVYVGKSEKWLNPFVWSSWDPSNEYLRFYRSTHSLLFFLFIIVVFYLFRLPFLLSLPVISHLLLDLISHGGVWATRPFYPFSDFHLDFFNWFGKGNVEHFDIRGVYWWAGLFIFMSGLYFVLFGTPIK